MNKKAKTEPKQAPQNQPDQNVKAKALIQTENFTESQNNFTNFHDEKELDLKDVGGGF